MNKKIFAALASATMALSATGSLAVFAEDFDVVTEANGSNGSAAGVVIPNTGIDVTEKTFPDVAFRDAVLKGTLLDGANWSDLTYGAHLTKDQLQSITGITVPAGAKDLTGIEYFKNITSVTAINVNTLVSADLSNNNSLETVEFSGVSDLETLILPETKGLTSLTVTGTGLMTAPIAELDLSKTKGLEDVTVQYTDIAALDLSGNYMSDVNVDHNKLNVLDLTNSHINTLDCSDNYLYELTLPKNNDFTSLICANNILQSLDVTGMRGLTTLNVANNELKEINFNDTKAIENLTLKQNHIGYLDLSKLSSLATADLEPQIAFVDNAFNAVNLVDTFPGIKVKNVTPVSPAAFDDDSSDVLVLNYATGTDYAAYTYATGNSVNPTLTVYLQEAEVLNRLYNPNSGEHFYTGDVAEKDALVELGWKDEGIGWTSPTDSNRPVYRLYNPNAGDHHYTMSSTERDTLVALGWKAEGIGWYSYTDNVNVPNTTNPIASIAVMREYNPNAKAAGAHNYTVNRAENDFLVSVGWLDEGLAWNAMK